MADPQNTQRNAFQAGAELTGELGLNAPQPAPSDAPAGQPTGDVTVNLKDFMATASGGDGWDTPLQAVSREVTEGAKVGTWDFLKTAAKQDWMLLDLWRLAKGSGYEFDPSYSLPDVGSERWKQLTKGIPEQYWDRFAGALSQAHAESIATKIHSELDAEEKLASAGGWGIAGRLLVGLADPATLALSAATGGIGTMGKAARLAQAARAATLAGDFTVAKGAVAALREGALVSSTQRALRAGAIAAGETSLIEALHVKESETRDGWDIVHAGLNGLVLGAGMSRLFSGAERRAITEAYLKERTRLHFAELEDNVARRRAQIMEDFGDGADLELARNVSKELDAVNEEVAQLKPIVEKGDAAQLDTRLNEVQAQIEDLKAKGADADAFHSLREQLQEVESQLRGRGKQRRALTQQLSNLDRKGKAISTQDQESRVLDQIRADLRKQDQAVYGDQVDSPKVARKREREAQAELARRRDQLPGDPKVAAVQSALSDAATAIEGLTAKAADLRKAIGLSADLRFAQREADALSQARARPQEAAARLEELTGRQQRLMAEQQRLSRHVQAAKDLDMLDEIAARTRNLISLSQEHFNLPGVESAAGRQAETYGRDTGGAARYQGNYEAVATELTDGSVDFNPNLTKVAKTASAKVQKALGTFTGLLRGSDNAVVRDTVGRYIGNSAGAEDGAVVALGASEVGDRIRKSMNARFVSAWETGFNEWRKANGVGRLRAMTRENRNTFSELVGRYIRGESVDEPGVAQAAQRVQKLFDDFRKEARAAGVKGFETLEANENYLPRLFNFRKLHELEKRIGTPNVQRLLAESFKSHMGEELDADLAERLAKGYLLRMKKLRIGADATFMDGLPLHDLGYLRHLLQEAGEDAETIDTVVGRLAMRQKERGKEGASVRFAKHRARLDENYEMVFRDARAYERDGSTVPVRVKVSDLFDNNVERLFTRYSRSMSGQIGMAKAAGVRSITDHANNLQRIRLAMEESGAKEIERVVEAADAAYKLVVGMPIEKTSDSTLNKALRTIHGYNFATTMNSAGIAQIPDLAGLFTIGYLRYAIREMGIGNIIRTMRRGSDGRLNTELLREIEEVFGLGTDYHNSALLASYDDLEEVESGLSGTIGRALDTAHHSVKLMGRGTQALSGMAFINSWAQRTTAMAIIQRLSKEALEGGAFSAKRLATMGIDKDMLPRIAAQIKKHAAFVDNGGTRLRSMGIASWDDVDARDAFMYGVFREARRIVQEEDLGESAKWMHSEVGKLLIQFRRFAFVSQAKQLLYGVNHRDAEEATRLVMSMTLGALSYMVQMELKAAAMNDEEAKRFRAQFLNNKALIAAAYSRSSYSGLIPGFIDTIAAPTLGMRFFDNRSSGQASDLVAGNPTFAFSNNLLNTLGAPIQNLLRSDRQFDRRDARALKHLLPYNNLPGMDFLTNPLIDQLPKGDKDSDPNHTSWNF